MSKYLFIIFLGLGGILHCNAMCGGFLFFKNNPGEVKSKFLRNYFFYNAGRIFTYSFLGFLFGLLGNKIVDFNFFSPYQKFVSVLGGILFVFVGLQFLKVIPPTKNSFFYFILSPFFKFFLKLNSSGAKFYLGIFSGFLPCSLTAVLFVFALSSKSPLIGFLYLLVFGITTSLNFLLIGVLAKTLSKLKIKTIYLTKLYGVVIIFLGFITLTRGIINTQNYVPHNLKKINHQCILHFK